MAETPKMIFIFFLLHIQYTNGHIRLCICILTHDRSENTDGRYVIIKIFLRFIL